MLPSFGPFLPPEVVRRIILAGSPGQPTDKDPEVDYEFLKTACLVHSEWKDISLPLIYSTVIVPPAKTVSFLATIHTHPTRTRWIKSLVVAELSTSDFFMGETQQFETEVRTFIIFFRTVVRFEWPLLVQLGSTYVPISYGSLIASFLARCPSLMTAEVHILEDGRATRTETRKAMDELADALRRVRSLTLEEEPDRFGRERHPFLIHLGRPALTTPSFITSLDLRGTGNVFGPRTDAAYKRIASNLLHLTLEDVPDEEDDDPPLLPPFLHHSPRLQSFSILTTNQFDDDGYGSNIFSDGHPSLEEVGLRLLWGRDFGRTMDSPNSTLVDEELGAIERLLDHLRPLTPVSGFSSSSSSSSPNFPRLKAFHLLRTNFVRPGFVKPDNPTSRKKLANEIEVWKIIYQGYQEEGGWLKWDETQVMWERVVKLCRARGLELRDDEGVVWEDGMGLGNSIGQVMWY